MGRTAILYIAERCNQSCVFCLEQDGSWTPFVDPTTQQVMGELGRLWDRGARHITFMGGETFFRKDLGRIVAHARDLGFTRVGVTTNGTVLSKKGLLAGLVASGLAFVELSIHGHTPELANAIGGTHFTFERQAEALAELDALALPTLVNVVICRENKAHLLEIVRYVTERHPRIPARFKLKVVSLQGQAATRAEGGARPLDYAEVDLRQVGDHLAARGASFWFYNAPLCRLGPHAMRALELEGLAVGERYFDFEHRGEAQYYDSGFQLEGRVWPDATCAACTLRPLCPGLEETHRLAVGSAALSTRDDDPLPLLRFALQEGGGDPAQAERRLAALRAEPRPARFERVRPEGALRFRHPAEPDPLDLLVETRAAPERPAYAATPRFTLSYRRWPDEDPGPRPRVAALLERAAAALHAADASGSSRDDARAAVAAVAAPGEPGWTCESAAPAPAVPPRRGLPLMA